MAERDLAKEALDLVEENAQTKAELKNIFLPGSRPFLRSFSTNSPGDMPPVDIHAEEYLTSRKLSTCEATEPTASLKLFMPASMTQADPQEEKPRKVVLFDDKETDPEGRDERLRKNHTFAGSLSEVVSHKDESYPHYHHVMSRHRVRNHSYRSKKVLDDAEKLPTIQDLDANLSETEELMADEDDMDETEAETEEMLPAKKLFRVGMLESESEHEVEPLRGTSFKKKHKHQKRHRSHHYGKGKDSESRRVVKGHQLASEALKETSGGSMDDLIDRDLEDLSHHRFDEIQSRQMIKPRKNTMLNLSGPVKSHDANKMDKFMNAMYGDEDHMKEFDHTPHELFVEMDELIGEEWVEQARWIKYEEAREEGAERWGKPHVSSLSFHSLLNLRLHLERGVTMFDFEARDMTNILFAMVDELNIRGLIDDNVKGEVLRILLYRHRYVEGHGDQAAAITSGFAGLRRNLSKGSAASFHSTGANDGRRTSVLSHSQPEMKEKIFMVEMESGAISRSNSVTSKEKLTTSTSIVEMYKHARDNIKAKYPIMNKLPEDSEGCLTLCGAIESISKPCIAFVRLAEGSIFANALEIPIPLRFVFLVLTPKPSPNMDCHEVGRSFSALMSNPKFHDTCYTIEDKEELLNAINDILDESLVLPPGDWQSRNLLSMHEIREMKRKKRERKAAIEQERLKKEAAEKLADDQQLQLEQLEAAQANTYDPNDPMSRAPYIFGGMINDLKRRFPHYWSDIKDGLNPQVLAATIFIYFAALSGAVALGGLLGKKTTNFIGVPETLLVSCIAGMAFSLFSCNPMIITGLTGPLLLFDEALFKFSQSSEVDFLSWRVWISFWLVIFALTVALFQGSVLVKYFTKFTKDIFSSLISLLFIYEAINKLVEVFKAHPLKSIQAHCEDTYESYILRAINEENITSEASREARELLLENFHDHEFHSNDSFDLTTELTPTVNSVTQEPNTALLSAFLMIATFVIAYYLRLFRNGHYLGRTARRALGDFGVPIAIVIMVGIDILIEDTYTETLVVPDGLDVSDPSKRGWFISPISEGMPVWIPFVSAIPAMLLFVLLFMETQICELLMMEKTSAKGAGLHWDIVLLCLINVVGALIGGPWICAATVRAVAHVSALTVMSTNHAPGEQPYIVEVKDQRLSNFFVSLLVGVSIMMSPLLQLIPFAVLFGVFLYMGISSIGGIQLFDRLSLLFMPVKHHPRVSYVRRVKTWKMHLYTVVQVFGLAVLWAVKSSSIALVFPFFVLAMVPLRMSLKFIFSQTELEALDGPNAGKVVRDEEPDFYEQGGIGG